MTDSAASFVAVLFGVGVFLVIVAIGWRSVQNRRILRIQGANGQETIIVAKEDDEISNVVTTEAAQPAPAPAPTVVVVAPGAAERASPSESAAVNRTTAV